MRVIFFGSHHLAVPALRALCAGPHEVAAVVTQPDRPAGRGRHVRRTPVSEAAAECCPDVPLLQPEKAGDELAAVLREYAPDLLVVADYGEFLSPAVLAAAARGAVNIHPSLLPRYRGATPIQRAILHGDPETGVTILWMTAGMDDGDIILQRPAPVRDDDTSGVLEARLADIGAEMLGEALDLIAAGSDQRRPQDSAQATFAPLLTVADAEIDWTRSAEEIARLIRALDPAPGAFTFHRGKRLKIWAAEARKKGAESAGLPGKVIESEQGFMVVTADGVLVIRIVQPENRKRMPASDYHNGYCLSAGDRLGRTAE
jgi:methionyl-tRNA formyltransferase